MFTVKIISLNWIAKLYQVNTIYYLYLLRVNMLTELVCERISSGCVNILFVNYLRCLEMCSKPIWVIMKEKASLLIPGYGLVASFSVTVEGNVGLRDRTTSFSELIFTTRTRGAQDEAATLCLICLLYFHYSLLFVLHATELPLQFHRVDWRPSSLRPVQEALALRASARCFCHGELR